jgi:broad specificity phosphatase PhoE
MIRILLIRHGEAELTGEVLYGRMPGVHLSPEGSKQAERLSIALRERYSVGEIISSPLERALETARYLADHLNLPISTDDGIIELDYGTWMGKPFSEIRELEYWRHYNRARSISSPPGGESMMHVQARAWATLDRTLERLKDDEDASVAMVSHGDVIRALLILLLGMPLDFIHRFEIAPASLTELLFDGRYVRVIRINQVF